MEFDRLVARRHMTRAFKPTPVPEEKIEKILHHAVRAPSAGHLQPWEFILIRDRDIKMRLAEAALQQYFLAEAPVVIATCANTRRSASRYGERGVHFYSLIDTAFASLLIQLTAINEGLGCCFVGAFHDEEISRILGLPNWVRPVGLIGIGYPAERAERYPRIPIQKVLHHERW